MDRKIYDTYVALIRSELTMATGCTEPIAIAYAGARLREVLGTIPEHCTVFCSGNMVKNVFAVTVPNSGGARGIDTAALLGIVGGDAAAGLDVLHAVTEEHIALTHKLVDAGVCDCELAEGVANLYIRIEAEAGDDRALIEITDYHTNITRLEKNGVSLLHSERHAADVDDERETLENQLACNRAIAEEGLKHPWGAQVGSTILEGENGDSLINRARAWAAAGSDARMNGCPLPVVINSGSGNQGITVSMPVWIYAKEYGIAEDDMLRALALANLVSLNLKRHIGSLSAFCGATSAATGAACGVAYMLGESYETICGVVTNTLNTIGGMVCDGAKSSCAAKIASAVGTALLALDMSRKKRVFKPGEGLVKEDVEDTIASVGRMGREGMKSTDVEIEGMKSTDVEILKIMLGK